MADDIRLLTVDEVADELRTSSTTVRRYLRAGKLPGFRLDQSWRISRQALDGFLAERSTRQFTPSYETKEARR
jgi:excisionase family DNA binding protein